MTDFIQTSASRSLENAVQDHFIPAEAPWSGIVRKGQTIRIVDSEGQQAVDTLFYRADDFCRALFHPGHDARAGRRLCRHRHEDHLQRRQCHADDDGRHLRPPRHLGRRLLLREQHRALRPRHPYLHACRDNFVLEVTKHGMSKRDIVPNINFFMNVPIEPNGEMTIVDGISAARRLCRAGRRDGRALRHLQLPADQQSLQRLQPDADPRPDLGRARS